jgi:hypothetical protein
VRSFARCGVEALCVARNGPMNDFVWHCCGAWGGGEGSPSPPTLPSPGAGPHPPPCPPVVTPLVRPAHTSAPNSATTSGVVPAGRRPRRARRRETSRPRWCWATSLRLGCAPYARALRRHACKQSRSRRGSARQSLTRLHLHNADGLCALAREINGRLLLPNPKRASPRCV